MEASQFRGDGPSLDEIRADLENTELTLTQRRRALNDLKHRLRNNPDDAEALELLGRYENEFLDLPEEPVGERTVEGSGLAAVEAARRQATEGQ